MTQAVIVSGLSSSTTSGKGVRRVSGFHYVEATATFVGGTATFVGETTSYSALAVNEPILPARSTAVHATTSEDWQRFRLLADNWQKERGITSSVTKMVLCPSYQRIIAMGEKVVPLILREIESNADDPDHWFWALEMITGEDPVPVQAYGDTVQMAQAWLEWAKGRYAW